MDAVLEGSSAVENRLQGIIKSLSQCKIEFSNEKEECKRIREINTKLEVELKEARELEKSHRYHLLSSREMIGHLQETVSQLVFLKRDIKKLKEEMIIKDSAIAAIEIDKQNIIKKYDEIIAHLKTNQEMQIDESTTINERKIQQVLQESDTQIAQYTCVIEELKSKLKEAEAENRDKMNIVVLEYEEKIQRGAAQVSQLQEQLSRQAARTDANIDAYRRRLEELEEKLKQSQFKQYLAQSTYPSQYESQVERPYSVNRESYTDNCSVDLEPTLDYSKNRIPLDTCQNKALKPNTLQVMYYGNKTPNVKNPEKKGFNISKKRKLYNDKDFQDF